MTKSQLIYCIKCIDVRVWALNYQDRFGDFGRDALKVLVVDDDPVQVTLISELVEIFDVENVHNGDDALRLFKEAHDHKEPYDLMFMDLMMPGFNGYMLLEAIRAYELEHHSSRLRVVVISGKNIEEGLTDRLNEQCDEYLSKPVNSDMILRSLENLRLL